VTFAQLAEGVLVDVLAGRHRHLARRDGHQRRRPLSPFEYGPFAEHGAGAQLGEALAVDIHAEDTVEQYGGLSRMVNRNDDTVSAVFVGGRAVFLDGEPTDLVGRHRTGRFLRAAHKAPAVPAHETEFASVS